MLDYDDNIIFGLNVSYVSFIVIFLKISKSVISRHFFHNF